MLYLLRPFGWRSSSRGVAASGAAIAALLLVSQPHAATFIVCLLCVFARTLYRRHARPCAPHGRFRRGCAVDRLAEAGRWHIHFSPRRHVWSDRMAQLAGFAPDRKPCSGEMARTMPEALAQIEAALAAHAHDDRAFTIEFKIEVPGSATRHRLFRARAANVFSAEGKRTQVEMVVRDVTEECLYAAPPETASEQLARRDRVPLSA